MLDNTSQISKHLLFSSEDDFYHLQILKRKKEHPDLGSNSLLIKTYYIRSIDALIRYMPEVKCLCDFHNARAYINLNKRSFEKASYNTLKKITDQLINKDYKSTRNAFNSVVGAIGNPKKGEKKWIIDIDIPGMPGMKEASRVMKKLPKENYVDIFKTKNGVHLIVKPFNIKEYLVNKEHEIQKNNPTIIYVP